MTRSRTAFGALAVITVAAVAGTLMLIRTHGSNSSGIRGTVHGGCLPPVVCLDVPLSATQVIYRRTDRRLEAVKRFSSSKDGSFKVDVAPGRYVIDSQPGQRWGRMRRAEIVVRGSRVTNVELIYNTGGPAPRPAR